MAPFLRRLIRSAFVTISLYGFLGLNTLHAREIKDMKGTPVRLKDAPSRIADLWHAHNEITVMLGGAQYIKVSAENPHDSPLLFAVAPQLKTITYGIKSNTVNREFLLSQHVDLAFTPTTLQADSLRFAHIPTLASLYTNFEDMQRSIAMTAQALNTDEAYRKAHSYQQALHSTQSHIASRLAHLTEDQKPSVLHIAHMSPLLVDGKNTLIDAWIQKSGGRNSAVIEGNRRPVSAEQILLWNPDIIILEADSGPLSPNSPLRFTRAGKSGKIWRNPHGIFAWDRYGCEVLLQLLWSAQHLHPNLFADLDMDQNMIQFYDVFFSYHPNQSLREKILSGAPLPQTVQ